MPELPEVETIKTALEKSIGKTTITNVLIYNNSLRIKIPDDFTKRIVGAKITEEDMHNILHRNAQRLIPGF